MYSAIQEMYVYILVLVKPVVPVFAGSIQLTPLTAPQSADVWLKQVIVGKCTVSN